MAGLKTTWRWRVSHRDIAEIAEVLEPVVAKSAPLLRRMSYVITRPDGTTLDYDGDLRIALRHVTDPVAIQVPYTDAGRSFGLGVLWIEVDVHQSRLGFEVDLTVTGPGTDSTDERMERARDRVDAELGSRGWKLGDAEVVRPHTEATGSPSAHASRPEREDARLSKSAAARYLGLTRQFIDALIENGTLPAEEKKVGNRTIVTLGVDDLERYRVARDARNARGKRSIDASPAEPVPPASGNTDAPADAAMSPDRRKPFWDSMLAARVAESPPDEQPNLHRPLNWWWSGPVIAITAVCTLLATIATDGRAKLLACAATVLTGVFAVGANYQIPGWRRILCATGAIVSFCVALMIVAVNVWPNTAESPPQAVPTFAPTPSSALTTTTATTTATTALNVPDQSPRSPVERDIFYGKAAEFFDGALFIGGEGTGGTTATLNLTTHEIGCPKVEFRIGEEKLILGKRANSHDFFRITLLDVAIMSATVRVEELPPKDWPAPETAADLSTYYTGNCPS